MEFAINSWFYVNQRLNIKQYIGHYNNFATAKLAVIVQSRQNLLTFFEAQNGTPFPRCRHYSSLAILL